MDWSTVRARLTGRQPAMSGTVIDADGHVRAIHAGSPAAALRRARRAMARPDVVAVSVADRALNWSLVRTDAGVVAVDHAHSRINGGAGALIVGRNADGVAVAFATSPPSRRLARGAAQRLLATTPALVAVEVDTAAAQPATRASTAQPLDRLERVEGRVRLTDLARARLCAAGAGRTAAVAPGD